ncbi:MAG: MFS transporter [Elainella sp. Prado103]|nr:MFS transporter [Elainella sp. Prado103]
MATTKDQSKLWVLLAAGSLAVMPGAVIIPVLGDIKTQLLNDSLQQASWLASAHYSMTALFSPLLGFLANRIGWVRVLVMSLVLFAVFGIAGTWATSFLPMLISRLLLGAATGGIAAASLGILAQMYDQAADRSHAIALASSAISLSNIVFPLLAGILGADRWQVAFYLYGISIPIAIAAVMLFPKQAGSTAAGLDRVAAKPVLVAMSHPTVLRFFLTLLLTSATALATVTNLSIYLRNAPISAATPIIGLILASQAIGSAAISAFSLKGLTRRFGAVLSIGIGLGLMAFSLVAIPNLQQVSLLLPVAMLFGIGLGIVIPSHYAALANVTAPELQAIVLAVGTGMTFLGQFLSPGLFGFVLRALPTPWSEQPMTVFYLAAGLVLSMGFLLVASSRHLIQAELAGRSQ